MIGILFMLLSIYFISLIALCLTFAFLGCQNSMIFFHLNSFSCCHVTFFCYCVVTFSVLSPQLYFSPVQRNGVYIFRESTRKLQQCITFLLHIINSQAVKRNIVFEFVGFTSHCMVCCSIRTSFFLFVVVSTLQSVESTFSFGF
jgi:hypothetical protein